MRERSAGVLLHISSLPAPYGIGDLGPAAHSFAATLAASGLAYWQFLPLSPTSEFIGNSPYSSPSAFAGNPLFISPELLCAEGYLSYADLECDAFFSASSSPSSSGAPSPHVDYSSVTASRKGMLNAAFERYLPRLESDAGFKAFCAAHSYWLDDYALFSAIKEEHGGASWAEWPGPLKWREEAALKDWEAAHRRPVLRHKFIQFIFFRQLAALHGACKKHGVRLIGDIPIYVTHDSADVWAAPEFFKLDDDGMPITVAGVPPDYFSATGQRWGNPVYNWSRMAADGFAWWKKRLKHNLLMADLVRLDHFRGFAGYWEIPACEETAVNGKWSAGPGRAFFEAVCDEFGRDLPIIAEDLGVITDDVRALMAGFGLPGMKVLHFGFGGGTPWNNPDIPFRHPQRSVVYTGTHDNTTSLDWFMTAGDAERTNFCNYIGRFIGPEDAAEWMMRLALESASNLAIIPMQDILGLGAEGRMNTPSVPAGNWTWKLTDKAGWADESHEFKNGAIHARDLPLPQIFARIYELCRLYGRTGLMKH